MTHRGFYNEQPFGRFDNVEYMIVSVYNEDGAFGACHSVSVADSPRNRQALREMGYCPLPNGWQGRDITAALNQAR